MKFAAALVLPSLVAATAIPTTFNAFVPTNVPEFAQAANFSAHYVPFAKLNALFLEADQKFNKSHTYVSTVNSPAILSHNIRLMLYAYALLRTGFPSGYASVEQISADELRDRIYLSAMLHDLGLRKDEEALHHLAHTTSFEIFGGFLAYDHLKSTTYPGVGASIVGDVIQSTNLHTSAFTAGKSSAAAQLLHICAVFDVAGWDSFGKGFLDSFWHNQTVAEIEKAYPRGSLPAEFSEFVVETGENMPDALMSHIVPPYDPAAIAAVTTLVR
ncbi:hypothetical protein AAF712_016515 [Marasmius tenuissimus]|uniref:HD domain-containing protein n=1 Tax=Marasmius tenuissimus TaxID=585030 RepID=A0ABR2Z6I4_9AGAR